MESIQNGLQSLDRGLTATELLASRIMVLSGLIDHVSALFQNQKISDFFGEVGSVVWSLDLVHAARRWGQRTVTYIREGQLKESGKEIIADICTTARQIFHFAERSGLDWGTVAFGAGQLPVIGTICASLRVVGNLAEMSHQVTVIKIKQLEVVQRIQKGATEETGEVVKLRKEITQAKIECLQAFNSTLWGAITLFGLVAAVPLGPGAMALYGVYFYAVATFATMRNKEASTLFFRDPWSS